MANRQKKIRRNKSVAYILPIAVLLLIVPMIVRMAVIPMDGKIVDLMYGMEQNNDFFSYHKSNFFMICTVFSVALCVLYKWKNKEKYSRTVLYLPLLVYAVTAILSAYRSLYEDLAFFGTIDRYEGLYVLLSYLLVCAVCINMVDSEKAIRCIVGALGISTAVICMVGLSQLLGHDLFRSDFGKRLIIPGEYRDVVESINFKFDRTYATLQNPNYVGSFMAMTSVLAMTCLIFLKGAWKKCIAAVLLVLSLSNLFGSMSRAGLVGLAAALVLLLILAGKQNRRSRIIVIGGVAVIIIVFLGVDSIFNGVMLNRVKAMVQLEKQDNSQAIEVTPTDGDKLLVTSGEDRSYLVCEGDQFVFLDVDMHPIEPVETEGKYVLPEDRHKGLTFYYVEYQEHPGIHLHYGNLDVDIMRTGEEYRILNPARGYMDLEEIRSWGFEGYERIGSARGYIWSRTIPLLKGNIIYGQGPDTYALAFQQNDIFGKAIAFSDPWIIVDKPHNMYLQIGVNTGVISLLAFLALYLIYFIQCIPLYFKGKLDSFLKVSGAAFFLATFAYMVTGLFNDSVVSVAPVFWVLLGSGIGINLKNRAEKEAPVPAAVSATKVPVPAADGNRKAKKAWKKGKRQA